MLSAVWLTIEVMTRFILIWEEVKLVKVKATHPKGVVEDKSNEGEAGEDVAHRDQRHHCLADE